MGLLPAAQPVFRNAADASAASFDARSLAPLACDVSFTSDDSTPADVLVARQVEKLNDARFTALWWSIFDRLRTSETIAHPAGVMAHIQAALQDGEITLNENWLDAIFRFFDHLNQFMFQHQTIGWLAEAEFKLNLYGNGWESHPTLARFARGTIDSDAMRLAVYRASRINLAADAYGVATPRVVEGVGAGGFFLMRFTPADLVERFFPPLLEFCQAQGIETNAQLSERATPAIRALLDFASRTIGMDVLTAWPELVPAIRDAASGGYTRSAAAIWPQYPAVAFSTKDELIGLVGRYLYDVPERQRVAEEMRRQLVARFAHVSVNPRITRMPQTEVAA